MPSRWPARCEEKSKEWAKHCVQYQENQPWINEELKKLEENLPRIKESDLAKAAKTMRWLSPQSSAGFGKRIKRRSGGVQGEGEAEWIIAASSLYDDVFLDLEECHE